MGIIESIVGYSPCKDCNNRQLNCHSNCEAYLKWSKESKELKDKINDKKKKYVELESVSINGRNNCKTKKASRNNMAARRKRI